jgi:sentrin-specific protease 1
MSDGWLSKYLALVRSTFEFSLFVKSSKQSIESAEVEINHQKSKIQNEIKVLDAILGEIPPEALKPRPRPKYMYLSPEERISAESLLDSPSTSAVIASRNNIELSHDKIQCLRDREWLNDEVINFYMDLINDLSARIGGKRTIPKTYCWNSFFWLKLSDDGKGYNYKAVQRWTSRKKIDLFSFDRIIVPMNVGRNHWALGFVDLKNKHVRYYDSLAGGSIHTRFSEFILRYLDDEFRDKKKDLEALELAKSFSVEPALNIPQQENGFDCGVFMCSFAECLATGRDWIDFDQSFIPDMRRKILTQISNNSI